MKNQFVFKTLTKQTIFKTNNYNFSQIEKITANTFDEEEKIIPEQKFETEKFDLYQTNLKLESPPDNMITVISY